MLCDAALQSPLITGATDGHAYRFLRRTEAIFREMTRGVDLGADRTAGAGIAQNDNVPLFRELYSAVVDHGFGLRPFDESVADARQTRQSFAPAMEFLVDDLLRPRRFWTIDSTVRRWSDDHEIERLPHSSG